ncbi:MAG: Bax inhibitor-1 family protein [Fibrobacterales bacterium]
METTVFNRTQSPGSEMSPALYNLAIGITLCWGFAVNWWMVTNIDPMTIVSFGMIPIIIGYFASCMIGVALFKKSDNPLISFLGYNFVVVPFGLLLNVIVSGYNPEIVAEAIRTTGLVTALMMIAGTLFPGFFQKISGALAISLIVVIVVEVVGSFFFDFHHGIMDWIVAIIFCGYIGYDWGRANAIPKTLDNAVDSAAALYMDIINLFIRILRIVGDRR